MAKLIVSIFVIFLITSCASKTVIEYRDPPDGNSLADAAIPLEIMPPRYPLSAARNDVEGWVLFEFELNQQGNPVNIVELDSHPKGTFVRHASEALLQWTFKRHPEDDGKKKQYIMEFKLRD